MPAHAITTSVTRSVPLYRFVYGSFGCVSIGAVLLLALLLQPIHQVYADEGVALNVASSTETLATAESESESDAEADEIVSDETADTDQATSSDATADSMDEPQATSTSQDLEDVEGSDSDVATSSSTSIATDSDVVQATSTDAETESVTTGFSAASTTNNATTSVVAGVATTTTQEESDTAAASDISNEDGQDSSEVDNSDEDVVTANSDDSVRQPTTSDSSNETEVGVVEVSYQDDGTDEIATTSTTDAEVNVTSYTSVTNRENRHQFSEDQCVSVGDGSFYCSNTSAINDQSATEEVVYAALGDRGYKDIYLQTARDTINITDSTYDDAAPHYDRLTQTVVWHREIAGRYQIMSYDIHTQRTTQLTDTSANNMQPTRSDKLTVWQRWVDDYWQVVLYDGEQEQVLTEASVHNVAPYVRGAHIIWNTTSATGERQIAVYDTETGLISYIRDSEGGRVSNPRFVLVYDTTFANGDVVTQGYDPETGEVQPLSAIPREPLPDIPSPDPVGETRALVQNKTELQEEELSVSTDDSDGDSTASTSTEVSDMTLDLQAGTTSTSTELTEYDLVVPAATSTDSATTATTSAQ